MTPDQANEVNKIISDWKGECRHPDESHEFLWFRIGSSHLEERWSWCSACGYCELDIPGYPVVLDYVQDPTAWDVEIYTHIEKTGVELPFIKNLAEIRQPEDADPIHEWPWDEIAFYLMWSSTEQKAEALAQAIKGAQ